VWADKNAGDDIAEDEWLVQTLGDKTAEQRGYQDNSNIGGDPHSDLLAAGHE
jgi:hypothetical protein